jgi:copper resistance protein B
MTFRLRAIALVALLSPTSVTAALAQEGPQSPPWDQADVIYGEDAMAEARREVQAEGGAQQNYLIMADRLEVQFADDEDTLLWDGQGWYGGDINKFWLKTEGDVSLDAGEIEEAEVQALWSRAITRYFDLQVGLRYDLEPRGRTHAVFGAQGLAPYWFEVDAAAFLSMDGDLTARGEAEYDLHLTQRLVLQPRAEIELSAQDIPERGLGSGVTGIDAGIRLRYDIRREFGPYIGVEWQSAFGETRDIIEAAGSEGDQAVFLIGLRAWY